MRLFISYARVDKRYCEQIIDTLDIHEIWYDYRLHAGQKWWEEILRQLDWCEGVVYLMSPDSVNSQYCQKELAIAEQLGKHIFPVLIHDSTIIPASLRDIQYADLSKGLDGRAVKVLLSAIHIAERNGDPILSPPVLSEEVVSSPVVDPATLIDQAGEALDAGNYDRAVFLLKHARENGYESRFVDIQAVLKQAENALERQAYLREAEREYRPIVVLVKRQSTFKLGCQAFVAYRKYFPDYDPDNLAGMCLKYELPHIEWIEIPKGEVYIEQNEKRVARKVDQFRIGKNPITNGQFQFFVDAEDGYRVDKWWTFSPDAMMWHREHPTPIESSSDLDDNPRTNVSWYEAMAFCLWFSDRTGVKVALPNQQQWLRAAQLDNEVDKVSLNRNAPGLKGAPATSPNAGQSYWEWCAEKLCANIRNGHFSREKEEAYAGHGNRTKVNREPARNEFYYKLKPLFRYHSIGFRVACVG